MLYNEIKIILYLLGKNEIEGIIEGIFSIFFLNLPQYKTTVKQFWYTLEVVMWEGVNCKNT